MKYTDTPSQQHPYNTKQAAKYLAISPFTLESWRCRGGGPAYVKIGGAVRYRQADLDDFLSSRTRTSTSQNR